MSVSGIGTRDAALVLLLAPHGVAAPQALSFSLAYLACSLAFSNGLGGLCWLRDPLGRARGGGRRAVSARARRALELALLAAALAAIGVAAERALTDRFRFRADAEHLVMAWNLAHHGVVSRVDGHAGKPPKPDLAPRAALPGAPRRPTSLPAPTPPSHDLGCLARATPPAGRSCAGSSG